jgi:hypothetical protein
MKNRNVPPATPKPQTDVKPHEPETLPDGNYFNLKQAMDAEEQRLRKGASQRRKARQR